MNLESSLRELDGELRATEPRLVTTPADVRRQARRVRTRRRSQLAVAACVVAVLGAVVGPRMIGPLGSEDTSVAGEDTRITSAEELADVIRQIGLDHAPAGVGEDAITVAALDANGNPIDGADRDKASEWSGEFDYLPEYSVEIRLAHTTALAVKRERQSCDAALDTGSSTECDVRELADGSIVRTETRGVLRQDGLWVGVTTDAFEAAGSRLWMERSVRHQHPDGSLTTVVEYARADVQEALQRAAILFTEAEMSAIAADPELGFPAPPQTADGCDWVVNDKRSSHWCLDESVNERPEAGGKEPEAPPHSSGDLEVELDATASVEADLEVLARGFIDYALGSAEALPVAETVAFALGGEVSKHVDDIVSGLPNRRIWQFCPPGWEIYGASSCPIDALGPVKATAVNGTRLVITAVPGDVACAPERTGPLPEGRLVVIRPAEAERTCASDFSLALAADDAGRLTAIDLTLAAP